MQGFNHIAGGVTFTGLFCSFHDVNIFEKPEFIGATVFFALLPDIDHTKSLVGKAAYPLAKFLSVKFGHRTITHSLVFYIAVLLIVRAVELLYIGNLNYTIITAYSLLSHLIFDMCTKQGIPFFYPFSTRPCVLPANPDLRLRTSDLRSEAIVFVVFCCLMLFCMPLFSNGFWGQYNKVFLNYNHVQREAKRKNDLLEITFAVQEDTLRGLLVSETETKFIIHDYTEFKEFEVEKCKFLAFKHTGRKAKVKRYSVSGIGVDSIKKLLKNNFIKLQLQCNTEMNYFEGAILKSEKNIEKSFISSFDFTVSEKDKSNEEREVNELEIKINKELENYATEVASLEDEIDDLKKLLDTNERNYNRMSDFQKGRWISERREIEKQIEQTQRERYRKKRPDVELEQRHLEELKKKLAQDEIKCSGNFIIFSY